MYSLLRLLNQCNKTQLQTTQNSEAREKVQMAVREMNAYMIADWRQPGLLFVNNTVSMRHCLHNLVSRSGDSSFV